MSANWQVVRDRAEARGIRFTPAQDRRMRSRVALYWSTLAYQSGRYADARRLVLQSLAADPRAVAADPHGRIRVAACAATMLPEGLHLWLRDRFNGGRAA